MRDPSPVASPATPAVAAPVVATPLPPRRLGAVHWRGVATLFGREMRRFLKEWLETVIGPAFATVMYLAVFAFALGPDRSTPEGQQVLTFILPGLVLYAMLTRAGETTVFTIMFDKLEGIISDVLMAPLTPSEMTAAYALAGAAAGLITGAPVMLVAVLLFGLEIQDPLLFALFAAAGSLMLSLTGITVAIWAQKWDHVAAFFSFLFVPLTFLSGLFAPVEELPSPLATIIRANPIFYVIDGFRAGCIGIHSAPIGLSAAIVLATNVCLWILCDRLIRSGWRLKA